jgi:hypothetical protein
LRPAVAIQVRSPAWGTERRLDHHIMHDKVPVFSSGHPNKHQHSLAKRFKVGNSCRGWTKSGHSKDFAEHDGVDSEHNDEHSCDIEN